MTRYFLKAITVEGFRGINNTDAPLIVKFKKDAVNSLHAPNGVGKSSLYDALCFVILGHVPRLRKLQVGERGNDYVVNKFHGRASARVEVEFGADDGGDDVKILVECQDGGDRTITSPNGHVDPEAFLEALREDFVFVDYDRFDRFVDTEPLDRGRALASLIGLSRYSAMRQALAGAARTQNINADLGLRPLEAEISQLETALHSISGRVRSALLEVTGQENADLSALDGRAVEVRDALSGVPILSEIVGAASLDDVDFDALEQKVEAEEGGDARKKLAGLTECISALENLAVSQADIDDVATLSSLSDERDVALAKVGAAAVHSLLKDAKQVLEGEDWKNPEICPVCEGQAGEALVERLDARIAEYDQVAALDSTLVQTSRTSTGLSKLRTIESHPAMALPEVDRFHTAIDTGIQTGKLETTTLNAARDQLTHLEARRVERLLEDKAAIQKLQETLPHSLVEVTRKVSSAKQFREATGDYRATDVELSCKRARLGLLSRWKSFVMAVSDNFASAERQAATERLEGIQESSQELFESLVRGGPNVRPVLERAQNSENVDLKLADFFGLEGLSARALLSESYSNAVAAAIFLSAAMKHSGAPRFMVMDDVTSSFDAGHQFQLMEVLRLKLRQGAVADGLQFIVLSHDTALEKYFDKVGNTQEWHHQKLQGTPPIGRVMVSAQQAERLKALAEAQLNAGQVDLGAPLVRQYMEHKLGQVVSRLQIPMPPDYATRSDKRVLSTYLDSIGDAVRLFMDAGRCVLEPQQVTDFRDTCVPGLVGNFVSHYETGAGNPFNAYALLGVLQMVDDLAECFMYADPATGNRRYYRRLDRRD